MQKQMICDSYMRYLTCANVKTATVHGNWCSLSGQWTQQRPRADILGCKQKFKPNLILIEIALELYCVEIVRRNAYAFHTYSLGILKGVKIRWK